MLQFRLSNNKCQYRLIFQSSPYQCLTPLVVRTRMCTLIELICILYVSTSTRTKERDQISHIPNIIIITCQMLDRRVGKPQTQ